MESRSFWQEHTFGDGRCSIPGSLFLRAVKVALIIPGDPRIQINMLKHRSETDASPSFNLYRMVVLPAASKPWMQRADVCEIDDICVDFCMHIQIIMNIYIYIYTYAYI